MEAEGRAHLALQVAVREVEPVQVVSVGGVGGRHGEAPVAVLVNDIIGAGGRFGEGQGAVLDDGGGADGVEGFEFRRCEEG